MNILKYSIIPAILIPVLFVLNNNKPANQSQKTNQTNITTRATLMKALQAQPKISAEKGKQIAKSNGCFACHSTNGKKMAGPTWKNLYDHKVQLKDGTTIVADSAYIHEAIIHPSKQITKGFTPTMPSFSYLKKAQIASLIAYIKSLSDVNKSDSNS